ncbi:biotin--[acetyl-CoA-carboxylase] ligase [Planctomycetota bacterium]
MNDQDQHKQADEQAGVQLLELLRRNYGQWVQMEALHLALGLERQQIHKQIDQLQRIGLEIETTPVNGFRLAGPIQNISAELIEFGLDTKRVGKKVLVYEETDSTNDVAWQYAAEAGFDGLAVFAEHQRCGRGRLGRTWLAPKGSSILCSVLLQDEPAQSQEPLTLLAGLAAARAIEHTCGVPARINWPNDVTINQRKVAGTIVESRQINSKYCYVVGVGINCRQLKEDFPPEIRDSAMSLRMVTDRQIDRLELARQLLREIDDWWASVQTKGHTKLHDEWLSRCDNIGRRLTVVNDNRRFVGRVIDVNPKKGLMLQLDTGAVLVFGGATTSVETS